MHPSRMLAMIIWWLHAIVVVAGVDGALAGARTPQGPGQDIVPKEDIASLVESPDVVAQPISKLAGTVRNKFKAGSLEMVVSAGGDFSGVDGSAHEFIRRDGKPKLVEGPDVVPQAISPEAGITQIKVARKAGDAAHAVAMPASVLVRAAASSSFLAAPVGSIQNLFIPAIHRCDENLKQQFLKMYPGQADRSQRQTDLEKLLRIVHDVNAELGMPTILEGGSVLGFYRNCDVIPTDVDGDTAVLGHWLQGKRSIENLAKAYAARNVTLESDMCPHGPLYSGCELRAVAKGGHAGYVDVFVYATESACDEGPCSFFGSFYMGGSVGSTFKKAAAGKVQFEQADFLDMTFWIPTPTLEYLRLNYGTDWEDPIGGVYKNVDFSTNTTPSPDIFGAMMPPPEYVRSLEQAGRMREQQLPTATPAQ